MDEKEMKMKFFIKSLFYKFIIPIPIIFIGYYLLNLSYLEILVNIIILYMFIIIDLLVEISYMLGDK